MAKHRAEETGRFRAFVTGQHKKVDDLFERSFNNCSRCGQNIYVLADECRTCGAGVSLFA